MAIPFLNPETEDRDTKVTALIAVGAITIGLLFTSVLGAVYGTSENPALQGFFALVIAGAELLAAIAVVRFFLAGSHARSIVIACVFVALAWVCVQNVKRGVHIIMPDTFAEDAQTLRDRADLYEKRAGNLETNAKTIQDAGPEELARVRTRIASLEGEQELMRAQSPEKIKEAQSLLMAQGKYFGRVDGLRETLTEAAMRARGEEIALELQTRRTEESNMLKGASTPQQDASEAAALLEIEERAKARKAANGAIWLEIMLWALEGARSFGLWAFISGASGVTLQTRRQLVDDIELQGLRNQLADVKDRKPAEPPPEPVQEQEVPAAPETPDETETAPEANPEPIPEPTEAQEPELDPAPIPEPVHQGARKGGKNTGHNRKAAKIENLIVVGDWAERDSVAHLQAAE